MGSFDSPEKSISPKFFFLSKEASYKINLKPIYGGIENAK